MIPLVILLISSITHLFHNGFPSSVVFDEVFYGNFVSYYWNGTYFFDQHPPFFKLLMAFIGKVTNLSNYSANWDTIGNTLPDQLILLRLVPIFAGIILPLLIYAICRNFNLSKTVSLLASLLVCFENSLIVQSRFILPDIIMLVTGFSAILSYQEYRKRIGFKKNLFLIFSIVLVAITLSIKWTGATYFAIIFILEIYNSFLDKKYFKQYISQLLKFFIKYLLIIILIYLSLFAIHFKALPISGKGDVFMSPEFQKTLIANKYADNDQVIAKQDFFEKFMELNKVMFTANSTMTATHPNSSKWYTWPLMQRSIFYWQNNATQTNQHAYIYLIGNPFIYWLGTISVAILILISIFKIAFTKTLSSDQNTLRLIIFIILGYLINLVPFMLINRVMFLYHYETALIFSIIAIVFLVDILKFKKKIYALLLISLLAFFAFLYFSPLTYGTTLNDKQLSQRMWFKSWR